MQTITRSDGITYERKAKKGQYDTKINIRLVKDDVEKLKEYAAKENMSCASLIRELLEDFIERECK
jgi:predicted DNA binding CopG/RHH family protein